MQLATLVLSRQSIFRELHPSDLEPTRRADVLKARFPRENPRDIFRFLDLPAELRIMIYKLAFDFDSVEKYFDTYTNLVLASEHPRLVPTPDCRKVCPSILLANKFVLQEALPVLYTTPLLFTHGVLHARLQNVISPNLLRKLRTITITDAGHDLIISGIAETFHGVQRLIQQLAKVLSNGHQLKAFKFSVRAADFNWHLKHCTKPSTRVPCGINAFLAAFKTSMGCLRGIDNVIFEGDMPDDFKNEMIQKMTSPPETLFKLPLHIREKIYTYAANPNDGSRALDKYMRDMRPDQAPVYPTLTTPTVLFLNRQIYQEASDAIRLKKLIINGKIPSTHVPTSILKFIGRGTLQKALNLELNITQWLYLFMIPQLVDVFTAGHSLIKLHINFEDNFLNELPFFNGIYPDRDLAALFFPLSKLRDIWRVSFSGSLPGCYTQPLRISMESPVGSSTLQLFGRLPTGVWEELRNWGMSDEDGLLEDTASDVDSDPASGSEDNPIEIDSSSESGSESGSDVSDSDSDAESDSGSDSDTE